MKFHVLLFRLIFLTAGFALFLMIISLRYVNYEQSFESIIHPTAVKVYEIWNKQKENAVGRVEISKSGSKDIEVYVNSTIRKKLLCASFLNTSMESILFLFGNMNIMAGHCDWAVVIYDIGVMSQVTLCSTQSLSAVTVHCKMSASFPNGSNHEEVPRAVLFSDLSSLLPLYDQVFLLDEGVSLFGFDPEEFLRISQHGFSSGVPLVTHPLVSESTMVNPFFNYNHWKGSASIGNQSHLTIENNSSLPHEDNIKNNENSSNSSVLDMGPMLESPETVLASEVLLMESVAMLMDCSFLQWLLEKVVSKSRSKMLETATDWGLHRLICGAARSYSLESRNLSSNSSHPSNSSSSIKSTSHSHSQSRQAGQGRVGCAVVTGGRPVHYVAYGSITGTWRWGRHPEDMRQRAKEMLYHFMAQFPQWMLLLFGPEIDPLSRKSAPYRLRAVYDLPKNQDEAK